MLIILSHSPPIPRNLFLRGKALMIYDHHNSSSTLTIIAIIPLFSPFFDANSSKLYQFEVQFLVKSGDFSRWCYFATQLARIFRAF